MSHVSTGYVWLYIILLILHSDSCSQCSRSKEPTTAQRLHSKWRLGRPDSDSPIGLLHRPYISSLYSHIPGAHILYHSNGSTNHRQNLPQTADISHASRAYRYSRTGRSASRAASPPPSVYRPTKHNLNHVICLHQLVSHLNYRNGIMLRDLRLIGGLLKSTVSL